MEETLSSEERFLRLGTRLLLTAFYTPDPYAYQVPCARVPCFLRKHSPTKMKKKAVSYSFIRE